MALSLDLFCKMMSTLAHLLASLAPGGMQQGFGCFYSSLACGMLGFCQVVFFSKSTKEYLILPTKSLSSKDA